MVDQKLMDSSFVGCLLGGAVGDALGYPVEFDLEDAIDRRYGEAGIATLAQAAERLGMEHAQFSDDTQMTLFTAEGLVQGMVNRRGMPTSSDIWEAYKEWLATQRDSSRLGADGPRLHLTSEPLLNHLRAPGRTCLDAIRESKDGGTLEHGINDSKGCGGVMRVAPVGLILGARVGLDVGDAATWGEEAAVRAGVNSGRSAAVLAAEAAALTHSHPLGWLSAAALGCMISQLSCLNPESFGTAAREIFSLGILVGSSTVRKIWHDEPDAAFLDELVTKAVKLALSKKGGFTPREDRDNIHELGEGWVGEQALAIAVYAALAHYGDIAAAIRAAVNHAGDSDSTGAICGNLLGAFFGEQAIRDAFEVELLDGAELVCEEARSLARHAREVVRLRSVQGAQAGEPEACAAAAPRFANPPQVPELGAPRATALGEDAGMPYTPLTKKALCLSFEAHRDQRDKSGLPYVYHPFHLAEQMSTEEEACVALLHDVVEDGCLTFEELRAAGMPESVVQGVRDLTHDPAVPYLDYVEGLRTKPLARTVKLADLRHNANLARLDNPTEKDLRRRVRYRMAQAVLDDAADGFDRSTGLWHKRIPLDDHGRFCLSVHYRPSGEWVRLSVDELLKGGTCYEFDACHADELDAALGGSSLYEGLADLLAAGESEAVPRALDAAGIGWQELRYA